MYKMQCFVILLLCCLLHLSFGRPPQETLENYRDAEEAEYDEDDEETGLEEPREDDDAAVDEQFSVIKPLRRNSQDDEAGDNYQDQPQENNKPDRSNENNNDNEFSQESDNQEAKGISRSQQVNIKGRDSSQLDESNDMIYENHNVEQEHSSKNDKNKYNKGNGKRIGRLHFYNRYINRSPAKDKESDDNPHEKLNTDNSNRDRRDTGDSTDDGNNNQSDKDKKDFENFENEAEQAIIQKFIKKLNKKEVEELMSTLSADKRAILAQIINNGDATNLNKREITKKAGAVAENNLMDGAQSDSNPNSDPLINLSISDASQNNDGTGITASTNEDVSSTKEDDNKVNRRSDDPDEQNSERSEVSNISNDASTETTSTTSKTDNKREVSTNNFNKEGSAEMDMNDSKGASISEDELYADAQDEDMTQLTDDEAQSHNDYMNLHKRELNLENNADLSEPMKSLQESFSNANGYEDSGYYGGSNMVPLVRVKRNKEHIVKKRAAAILPESKVAYIPENEDSDNDEGDEFYDDGFFDRTANLAKSNWRIDNMPLSEDNKGNDTETKRSNDLTNYAAKDDTGIGSDTDNVLSGVEGVDEHLMYTGGSRKKRAADKTMKLEPADDLINNDMLTNPPRSSLVDCVGRSENYGVSYIGDEGFGPLSRSSEGELSRYKRIRRLKQQSANESPSSNNQAVD